MNRFCTGFGKHVYPDIRSFDLSSTDLAEFVGPDSWMFFALLQIDTEFLQLPVVNDAAERGVKLAADFLP